MKNIVIIRHGKAEPAKAGQSDRKRNLARKGLHDAADMAQILLHSNLKPDIIVSSPANRAFQTASIFAKHFTYSSEAIITEDFIYNYFNWDDLLIQLDKQIELADTIFVFGHNPTLEELANELCRDFTNFLPTCGIVGISYKTTKWDQIKPGKCKLLFFEFPKKYYTHE